MRLNLQTETVYVHSVKVKNPKLLRPFCQHFIILSRMDTNPQCVSIHLLIFLPEYLFHFAFQHKFISIALVKELIQNESNQTDKQLSLLENT